MPIPAENGGSLPRPTRLPEMIAKYDAGEPESTRRTPRRLPALGTLAAPASPDTLAADGHHRQPPRLVAARPATAPTPRTAWPLIQSPAFPRVVVGARGNARPAPRRVQRGLAKSWVQYGTPRPLYATATPTLRNRQFRMFARCPGLDIQSPMTSRALRWPQAMFSP